jgi:hypothetical protein
MRRCPGFVLMGVPILPRGVPLQIVHMYKHSLNRVK